MTDQCKHCTCRGNIEKCLKTKCFHHENWYAVEQQKEIERLKKAYDTSFKQAMENGQAYQELKSHATEQAIGVLDEVQLIINKAIVEKDFDYCSGGAIEKHIKDIFESMKKGLRDE